MTCQHILNHQCLAVLWRMCSLPSFFFFPLHPKSNKLDSCSTFFQNSYNRWASQYGQLAGKKNKIYPTMDFLVLFGHFSLYSLVYHQSLILYILRYITSMTRWFVLNSQTMIKEVIEFPDIKCYKIWRNTV